MLFEETELSNDDDDDDDDDDDNHTQFCNNTAKNSEQYSQNKLGSLATHVVCNNCLQPVGPLPVGILNHVMFL